MTAGKPETTSTEDQVITDKIMELVRSKTTIPVTPDSTLDGVGLDSLAMAEFVFEIEAEFKIRANDQLLSVHSFREVIDYVKQEIASRDKAATQSS